MGGDLGSITILKLIIFLGRIGIISRDSRDRFDLESPDLRDRFDLESPDIRDRFDVECGIIIHI
jgi:hypothetical protein